MVNCNAVLKFKFNVGEIVKVVDIGYTYASGYIDWFKENGYKKFLERYVSGCLPKKNKQYIVIARGEHGVKWVKQLLYAIEDFDTKQVYLLDESGLESVNKETRLHDLFTDVLEYTLLNRNFPRSFDFIKGKIKLVAVNHKKKQVIIRWNDGTKTKATCNEKDDFDIKVGFAIAFTRKFFGSDKKLDKFITNKLPKDCKPILKEDKQDRPKKEQFDLKKELEHWGLRPNREFKVIDIRYSSPFSNSATYLIDLNKRLCVKCANGTRGSCSSTEDLILGLVNGNIEIEFLDK